MKRSGNQSSPDKTGAVDKPVVTGSAREPGEPVRRRQRDPRDRAFETVGLMYTMVYDLEVWAADIQDDEVDQLVDVLRYDVRRLGNLLTRIGDERRQAR